MTNKLMQEQLDIVSDEVFEVCRKIMEQFKPKNKIEGTILICAMTKIVMDSVEPDVDRELVLTFKEMLISMTYAIAQDRINKIAERN